MTYVDGFVLPVKKRQLATYRSMAKQAGKIWRRYGALEFRECVADDVPQGIEPLGEVAHAARSGVSTAPWNSTSVLATTFRTGNARHFRVASSSSAAKSLCSLTLSTGHAPTVIASWRKS